jgi:hypothetical protein
MAWSDYNINYENPNFMRPYNGIIALVMALNERIAATGGEQIEVKRLSLVHDVYLFQSTTLEKCESTLAILVRHFIKPQFMDDLASVELDIEYTASGFNEVHSNSTWNDTAEVCAYLGEEEIKYNTPFSTWLSAAWLRQKIKIVNLLTVMKYHPGANYPCTILADLEYRSGNYYDYGDNYEQYVTNAIVNANNRAIYTRSGFRVGSLCNLYKNNFVSSKRYAFAESGRSRIYNLNSTVSKSYDIIAIAQAMVAKVLYNPENLGPYVYDAGDSAWVEDEKFILGRFRAENGVAEKTDWFGYLDFFPRPVPAPNVNKYTNFNAHRGYELRCAIIIDFRVPGGFEFQIES